MSETATATRTRIRGRLPAPVQPVAPTPAPRALDIGAETEEARDARLKSLVADFYRKNNAKNAATREAEKAQKALNAAMALANINRVSENVAMDGGAVVPVVAEITAEVTEGISVEKPRGLVDDATFMKIVSATKTAVEAHAGTNIVIQATVTQIGKESLKVRKVTA